MRWTRGPTIGHGSSATVSKAVDRKSGEILAVKTADLSNSGHLKREQEILSSLTSSPHIVGYRGFDVSEDSTYNLFMEFYPRGTLRDEIDRQGGKLVEADISTYTSQVVSGLEFLHSMAVVHCDLKPRNILIGDDGAKISDFGLSRRETAAGAAEYGGTPLLMAPEVARGESQGRPADVWALGCTIIEMATGKPPWGEFSGEQAAVLRRIAYSGESPAIPSWLSEQARDFLEKCLRRDPKLRWTSAQLLEHPFLEETTTSDESKKGKESSSWSPTCVLDDHGVWSSLEETEEIPSVSRRGSVAGRVERLSLGSGRPDWTWHEDWITLREDYDDMIQGNVAVINNVNANIGKQNTFSSIYFQVFHIMLRKIHVNLLARSISF